MQTLKKKQFNASKVETLRMVRYFQIFKNRSVQNEAILCFFRKLHFVVPKTSKYTDKNMCLTLDKHIAVHRLT